MQAQSDGLLSAFICRVKSKLLAALTNGTEENKFGSHEEHHFKEKQRELGGKSNSPKTVSRL